MLRCQVLIWVTLQRNLSWVTKFQGTIFRDFLLNAGRFCCEAALKGQFILKSKCVHPVSENEIIKGNILMPNFEKLFPEVINQYFHIILSHPVTEMCLYWLTADVKRRKSNIDFFKYWLLSAACPFLLRRLRRQRQQRSHVVVHNLFTE